jgi:hypothetical protein
MLLDLLVRSVEPPESSDLAGGIHYVYAYSTPGITKRNSVSYVLVEFSQ